MTAAFNRLVFIIHTEADDWISRILKFLAEVNPFYQNIKIFPHWRIKGESDVPSPSKTYKHFFPPGADHTTYRHF